MAELNAFLVIKLERVGGFECDGVILAFAFVDVANALKLNNEIVSIFADILEGVDLFVILKVLERVDVDISNNGVDVIFVDVPKVVVDIVVNIFERVVTLLFLKTVVVLKVECTVVDTGSVALAFEVEEAVDFFRK